MMRIAICISLGIALLSSCGKPVTQEELIAAAIEIKVRQWREARVETCKTDALRRAEQFVDSILIVKSLEYKLDTIQKPDKPIRPDKPVFKEAPDSLQKK